MAYEGLQDFLTEKKDLTVTLIRHRILPLYSLDPCSPYLISTASWIIGQLALCLPEAMSTNIYHSLMKALTMEDVEDLVVIQSVLLLLVLLQNSLRTVMLHLTGLPICKCL